MKTRWVPAILLTCLLVVGSTVHVAAGSSGYEGTGASLKLGLGARAAGMADAFVSLADDAAAVYYNPAGLAYLTTSGLVSAYHVQSGIAGYFGIGYAKHNLGAAVLTLSSGDIQGTDEFGNPTELFHASEGAILLAGAPDLALGKKLPHASNIYPQVLRGFWRSHYLRPLFLVIHSYRLHSYCNVIGRLCQYITLHVHDTTINAPVAWEV